MVGHEFILVHRDDACRLIGVAARGITLHVVRRVTAGLQAFGFVALLLGHGNLGGTGGDGSCGGNGAQRRTDDGDARHRAVGIHGGYGGAGRHLQDVGRKLLVGILLLDGIHGRLFLLLQLGGVFASLAGGGNLLVILALHSAQFRILQGSYQLAGRAGCLADGVHGFYSNLLSPLCL